MGKIIYDAKKELLEKRWFQKNIIVEIEEHIAKIRLASAVRDMDPVYLTMDKYGEPDELLGVESGYEPFSRSSEHLKRDPLVPGELRKLFNRFEPEDQNLFQPVFDEASRQESMDLNELKDALFSAKWTWYKEKTVSQMKLTTQEMFDENQIVK